MIAHSDLDLPFRQARNFLIFRFMRIFFLSIVVLFLMSILNRILQNSLFHMFVGVVLFGTIAILCILVIGIIFTTYDLRKYRGVFVSWLEVDNSISVKSINIGFSSFTIIIQSDNNNHPSQFSLHLNNSFDKSLELIVQVPFKGSFAYANLDHKSPVFAPSFGFLLKLIPLKNLNGGIQDIIEVFQLPTNSVENLKAIYLRAGLLSLRYNNTIGSASSHCLMHPPSIENLDRGAKTCQQILEKLATEKSVGEWEEIIDSSPNPSTP